MTVTTLNAWVGNRDTDAVIHFLSNSGSDVVVLQEVDARLETQLDEIVALVLGSVSLSHESPAAAPRHEAEQADQSAGPSPETPNG